MRHLLLPSLLGLSLLGGCASQPLPSPDPGQAWVDLASNLPSTQLSADRLDRRRLDDGRYFQMPPGAHELDTRVQYEVNLGGGSPLASGPSKVTCYLRVRYDGFAAGQRYQLYIRPSLMKADGWLYDSQRNVLARADVLRCGPY
jgi:hypothetical protein